jgi:hypothetical protein
MTPKEKANELLKKFIKELNYSGCEYNDLFGEVTKQCALIAVDEIINTDCLIDEDVYIITPSYIQYWQEVKQEIEKL